MDSKGGDGKPALPWVVLSFIKKYLFSYNLRFTMNEVCEFFCQCILEKVLEGLQRWVTSWQGSAVQVLLSGTGIGTHNN